MQRFKSYILTEAKLKAEDYEAAIVIGWYKIHNQDFNPEKTGVGAATAKMLASHPEVLASGEAIAAAVKKHFRLSFVKAEQYGRAKTDLSSFWKQNGGSNKTPKTDILIGNKRLSLKIGTAQLMSGGREETRATLAAALEESKIQNSPQLTEVKEILDKFVTASVAPGKLRELIKQGKNKVVMDGEKAHKQMMKSLGALFESNKDFKIAFAREAMSGFIKFGKNNNAAAEYMLVANHSGSRVSIKSVYDDAYCTKIADRMKLQARFKTSSRKIKNVKTGEYNFWSVVSLIVNSLDEETTQINPLVEFTKGGFKRAFEKIKKLGSNIISRVKRKASSLINFLGVEPNITVTPKVRFD